MVVACALRAHLGGAALRLPLLQDRHSSFTLRYSAAASGEEPNRVQPRLRVQLPAG